MAQSTGVALAVGTITAANEALFAPLAEHHKPFENFNWRIIPATLLFAGALAGLEKLSEPFAVGLGYIALFTVLLTRTGNAPAPIENIATVLGYNQNGKTGGTAK